MWRHLGFSAFLPEQKIVSCLEDRYELLVRVELQIHLINPKVDKSAMVCLSKWRHLWIHTGRQLGQIQNECQPHPCQADDAGSTFSLRLLMLNHLKLFCISLQNSPLFQYLHDLGHTDFEACPTASQEEEYYGQEGDLTSPHEDPQNTSVSSFCVWHNLPTGLSYPLKLRLPRIKWED